MLELDFKLMHPAGKQIQEVVLNSAQFHSQQLCLGMPLLCNDMIAAISKATGWHVRATTAAAAADADLIVPACLLSTDKPAVKVHFEAANKMPSGLPRMASHFIQAAAKWELWVRRRKGNFCKLIAVAEEDALAFSGLDDISV